MDGLYQVIVLLCTRSVPGVELQTNLLLISLQPPGDSCQSQYGRDLPLPPGGGLGWTGLSEPGPDEGSSWLRKE